mmetsp:Transcript_2525/g.8896  ORF Transcript_2525/g.8896 Transcript_2525/m.8896 type:complete len:503 (-) Transcript_2525:224-1732(-)
MDSLEIEEDSESLVARAHPKARPGAPRRAFRWLLVASWRSRCSALVTGGRRLVSGGAPNRLDRASLCAAGPRAPWPAGAGDSDASGDSGSVLSAAALVAGTTVGAGVLALPYAYARAGTIGGPVLITVSGLLNIFTMHLVSIVSRHQGRGATFHSLAGEALPPALWWAVDLTVLVLMFGLASSYLMVFGNVTKDAVGSLYGGPVAFVQNRKLWVSAGLVFVAPPSFSKTLDALKFTSALAMGLMLLLSALIVYYWVGDDSICGKEYDDGPHCGGKVKKLDVSVASLQALSLATFAFTAQAQCLQVANELRGYTQRRMDFVTTTSIALCSVLYCIIGMAGYETFGDGVDSDLLESYLGRPPITAARFVVAFVVGSSYPLMVLTARSSAATLLRHQTAFPKIAAAVKADSDGSMFVFVFCFVLSTYIVALSVADLGAVLSLLGATASATISYIVPSRVFLKLSSEAPSDSLLKRQASPWKVGLAKFVFVYGFVTMPPCIAATFL